MTASFTQDCSESITLLTSFSVQDFPGKKNHRVLTIIIVTCRVSPPKDHKKHKGLLVIDVTMFEDLYGILAPLLKPQITNRLAINTVDQATLATYFNENVADRIIHVRGSGFKDKSDLEKRMLENGGLIEDEKGMLDDCNY